jgi:hypothetical protein
MKFMSMHQEICLESKGWKKVPDRSDHTDYFWTPDGWIKPPSGTKALWRWKGEAMSVEFNAQYKKNSDECTKEAGIINKNASRAQIEVWFACMWKKDWRREPVRQEQPALPPSKPLIYWRPSGWVTAPPGTKKIDWVWQGHPDEEAAATKRFLSDKEGCLHDVGFSDPRTSTTSQGEAFMACMWAKKWGPEPIN